MGSNAHGLRTGDTVVVDALAHYTSYLAAEANNSRSLKCRITVIQIRDRSAGLCQEIRRSRAKDRETPINSSADACGLQVWQYR